MARLPGLPYNGVVYWNKERDFLKLGPSATPSKGKSVVKFSMCEANPVYPVSEIFMTQMILPTGTLPQAQVFGEPQLHTDGDLLALTFAPDGSLWSVEEPGVLRQWNAVNGQQLDWQALSDLETLWTFSRDGRLLASASDDDLTLWDVSSGQVLTALHQDAWVTALAFGQDTSNLATGHDDGTIRYWDASTHHMAHEFRLHKRAISALAISKDGKILAAAGEDKIITLWDTATGKARGKLTGHTDRIPALAFHPSGDFLISAGWDTTARVWNLRTQEPVILLNTHNAQVTALAISEDGNLLASADSGLTVHVWDFKTKKPMQMLKGPQGEIRCLAFSPSGKELACSGERMIHLWDLQSGKPLAGAGPRPLAKTSLAVSTNGKTIATNGGGSAPRVWDTAAKKAVFNLEESDILHGLAYSPDGKLLAGAALNHIRLWDAATGKFVKDLDDFEEQATNLAFSPDSGKLLALRSSTGQDVWIWRRRRRQTALHHRRRPGRLHGRNDGVPSGWQAAGHRRHRLHGHRRFQRRHQHLGFEGTRRSRRLFGRHHLPGFSSLRQTPGFHLARSIHLYLGPGVSGNPGGIDGPRQCRDLPGL